MKKLFLLFLLSFSIACFGNVEKTINNSSYIDNNIELSNVYEGSSYNGFRVVPREWSSNLPPYDFYMKEIKGNTLSGEFTLTYPYLNFALTVHSTVPCTAYLFHNARPDLFSRSYSFYHFYIISGSYNPNMYTYHIPLDDVMVTSGKFSIVLNSLSGNVGNATVRIVGYDDISELSDASFVSDLDYHFVGKVSPVYINCPQEVDSTYLSYSSSYYNVFTSNSNRDMKLCLISGNRVVAYNDNYINNSDYNWGNEARLKYRTPPNGIIAYSANQTDSLESLLFIGCQTAYNPLRRFPNLKEDDAILSASSHRSYNCVSWAIGTWLLPYQILTSVGQNILNNAEDIFGRYGLTTEGATEENSQIDCWAYNGEFTHLSIKSNFNGLSYGYAWESKDADLERFMHPRYALACETPNRYNPYPYGNVVCHFITNENYMDPRYVRWENVQYTDIELAQINSMISKLSQNDIELFNTYFENLEDTISTYGISNLNLLREDPSYISLKELCKNNENVLGLAHLRFSEGHELGIQLIRRCNTWI